MPTTSVETGISAETVSAVMQEINGLGRALKDFARPELTEGLHLGSLIMLGLIAQHSGAHGGSSGGGLRCSAVAERMGLDVSVASRQLSALDALGLTVREPDPTDGRAWLSRITPAGAELLARLRERSHRLLKVALSTWHEDELVALLHQLSRLNHDLLHAADLRADTGRTTQRKA